MLSFRHVMITRWSRLALLVAMLALSPIGAASVSVFVWEQKAETDTGIPLSISDLTYQMNCGDGFKSVYPFVIRHRGGRSYELTGLIDDVLKSAPDSDYTCRLRSSADEQASSPSNRVRIYKSGNAYFAKAPDTDGDGVADSSDNCTEVANADQRDTDGDGFGNICDPDFNNNRMVDPFDVAVLKSVFASANARHQDLDGDGMVTPMDLSILKAYYARSPGPSCCER